MLYNYISLNLYFLTQLIFSKMRNLIEDPKEFLSQLSLFLKSSLKKDVLHLDKLQSIFKLMNLKRIHIDLNLKKDSFDEAKLEALLLEFFNLNGYQCELTCKGIPNWNIYNFSRNGETIGTFNFDIYQGEFHNKLLVTVSSVLLLEQD